MKLVEYEAPSEALRKMFITVVYGGKSATLSVKVSSKHKYNINAASFIDD